MKKFAFIFGIVLMAALLVGAGYWLGFDQRSMTEAYYTTVLEKSLVNAGINARVLQDLDSGQIDRARRLLRTQLDGEITIIWAFGDYSEARSRKLATNVLAGIATYRAKSASVYTNRTSEYEAEMDARIASMLEQARKQQTN